MTYLPTSLRVALVIGLLGLLPLAPLVEIAQYLRNRRRWEGVRDGQEEEGGR